MNLNGLKNLRLQPYLDKLTGKAAEYAKAVTTGVGVAVVLVTALNVHASWVPVLLGIATVLGVGVVRNRPPTK